MGGYRDSGKRICHHRLPYPCDGGEYRDGGKLVGEGDNHHADDYDSCAAAESAVCVHACSEKLLVILAVFFTIFSGADYIIKNKQVLMG